MDRTPSLSTVDLEGPIGAAAQEYLDRNDARSRPVGHWDRAGRFWLDEPCTCPPVRRPTRAFPHSQLRHGCRATHVARLYGVERRALLVAARLIRGPGGRLPRAA